MVLKGPIIYFFLMPPQLPSSCLANYTCTIANANDFFNHVIVNFNFLQFVAFINIVAGMMLFLKTRSLFSVIFAVLGVVFLVTKYVGSNTLDLFYASVVYAAGVAFMIILWVMFKRLRE